jgi:hypothetical protein
LESHGCELLVCRQIGYYFDIDLPCPQLAWHLRKWWNRSLGEVAVPLGPGSLLAVGQVEGVDDIAALPAVVWRRIALW